MTLMEVLLCVPFRFSRSQLNLSLQPGEAPFFNVDSSGAAFVGPSSHLLFALFLWNWTFSQGFDAVVRRIAAFHFRSSAIRVRYQPSPALIRIILVIQRYGNASYVGQ